VPRAAVALSRLVRELRRLATERGDALGRRRDRASRRLEPTPRIGCVVSRAVRDAPLAALESRLDLACEIHERIVPLLIGMSLRLHGDGSLPEESRRAYGDALATMLAELRATVSRPPKPPKTPEETLGAALQRLQDEHPELAVDVRGGAEVPGAVAPLVAHFLGETILNVARHARPSWLAVSIHDRHGTLSIEVENDGVESKRTASGAGLRLIAQHALQYGAIVEFGASTAHRWRARLVVPT
jgi:signal transduction histidine kinase